MPITVLCECGKVLTAKDSYAGKTAPCPQCSKPIEVPAFIPVAAPAVLEPVADTESQKPRRPFYRDPVLLIGGAVPTIILAVFMAYLARENAAKTLRARIFALKAEADNLADSNRPVAALDRYNSLLDLVGGREPADSQLTAELKSARRSRDKLVPIVKAWKEQQETERLARIEAMRLASLSVDVRGGVWAINKLGMSMLLRGFDVYLINSRVPKRVVADLIDEAASRASVYKTTVEFLNAKDQRNPKDDRTSLLLSLKTLDQAGDRLMLLPSEAEIDTQELYSLARVVVIGGSVDGVVNDQLWPKIAARCLVSSATTDIDGKYVMNGVRGGNYYMYALHSTDFGLIEWMTPLKIDQPREISCDLHNNKAILILNKKQ